MKSHNQRVEASVNSLPHFTVSARRLTLCVEAVEKVVKA
jgi:hypothetical protein